MKKLLAVLVVLTMVLGVFALDISVGGNADFSHTLTVSKFDGAYVDTKTTTHQNFIGVNAFADLQYAVIGVGANFLVGDISGKTVVTGGALEGTTEFSTEKQGITNVNLQLLGKYPVISGSMTMCPLLGGIFSFNVARTNDGTDLRENMSDEAKQDLNSYYVVAGVALDFDIARNLYFRATPLVGYRLNRSKVEQNTAETLGDKYSQIPLLFNIGLGVGYKL